MSKGEWKASDTITPQEDVLNWYLTDRRIDFVRQHEVKRPGNDYSYWLDFALPQHMVAIEIDGHPINLEREALLVDLGWKIIHLQNEHFATRKIQSQTWESLSSLIASYVCIPKGAVR